MPEHPPIQLVLVDFDDTLVDTAPRFEGARRDLFELLASAGFDRRDIDRVHHHEVDPTARKDFGLGPQRMPHAFAETYRALCRVAGCDIERDLLLRCRDIGVAVTGTPPPLDGALAALRRLAAELPTAIYTQAGNVDYQIGCVRDAGAAELVGDARVRVVPLKTPDALRETLDHFQVRDPSRARMVGNSIRADINPALEVGVPPILVEVDDPWRHDVVDPIANGFPIVRSFRHAVELLLEARDG